MRGKGLALAQGRIREWPPPEGWSSEDEILRGVYPEATEILRYAQNDAAEGPRMTLAEGLRMTNNGVFQLAQVNNFGSTTL